MPKVSIIIPVFNADRYLEAALESIYKQTFRDWELIVVDDGSTDNSASILAAQRDPRLVLLPNERNIGYTQSINRALEIAQGEFIARLDADDIAEPERLARQITQFEEDPHLGILGCSYVVIDENDNSVGQRLMPQSAVEVLWSSLLHCPFSHPSIMFRRSILKQYNLGYEPSWEPAEDYDLWTRMLAVVKGANTPEFLIRYRSHGPSVSNQRAAKRIQNHHEIASRTIRQALPRFQIESGDVQILHQLSAGARLDPADEGRRAEGLGKYLDLLTEFIRQYPEARQCDDLLARETGMILREMRPLRGSREYLALAARLARLFPGPFCVAWSGSLKAKLRRPSSGAKLVAEVE